MSENVFSFFKKNVGEEDVIKLLLISAGKALVTVAILLIALLSFFKLSEWYGFGFITLLIATFTMYTIWSCLDQFGNAIGITQQQFDFFDHKTWKYIFNGLLPLNKIFYFDNAEIRNGSEMGSSLGFYAASWLMSVVMTAVTFIVGIAVFFIGFIIYALIMTIRISIIFPPESILTIITVVSSVIIMSALFIKLKWRKIWLNGFNLNLVAWCICAAFVITTIAFVAGVAIRRIAGFIGIEYTAILVSLYVVITATYVYLDLKQWIANKSRESVAQNEMVESNTQPISP
jgi:hypothetical protein